MSSYCLWKRLVIHTKNQFRPVSNFSVKVRRCKGWNFFHHMCWNTNGQRTYLVWYDSSNNITKIDIVFAIKIAIDPLSAWGSYSDLWNNFVLPSGNFLRNVSLHLRTCNIHISYNMSGQYYTYDIFKFVYCSNNFVLKVHLTITQHWFS